ncbi:MAG: hypothetical protein LBJ72_11865 [Dysgonamonadaceae bacterium]|jgi:hypothetical protein|nr:hypothetical protein [Dysgonamonadaceae bacterium]
MGLMKKLSEQTRRPRNSGSNGILPLQLEIESVSEVAKYQRSLDSERMNQFNQDVKTWAKKVNKLLRASAQSKVERDFFLSKSIKPTFGYDKQYAKEIKRVGFSFQREGIYIHKGAGKGQGGYKGSKWTDSYGQLKETNPESFLKMGTGNRKPIEWFNPVIESQIESLADIVAEYSGDLQINATRIIIPD